MTSEDFRGELYREHEWRFDEVRALKNAIAREPRESRDNLRKSIVILLYAHFEGFCIFALQHYLNALNQLRLPCHLVIPAVIAGAWDRVFNAMEHGDQKSQIFRQALPQRHSTSSPLAGDDTSLKALKIYMKGPIEIDEKVIDR